MSSLIDDEFYDDYDDDDDINEVYAELAREIVDELYEDANCIDNIIDDVVDSVWEDAYNERYDQYGNYVGMPTRIDFQISTHSEVKVSTNVSFTSNGLGNDLLLTQDDLNKFTREELYEIVKNRLKGE